MAQLETSQLGLAQLGLLQIGLVEPSGAAPPTVPAVATWYQMIALPQFPKIEVESY